MGGSSKGGGGKGGGGGGSAAASPVAAPPVSQAPVQQLTALEQQYVNAPWSEPGWQSNVNPIAQGFQSQYIGQGSTSAEQNTSNDLLSQWLFGSSSSSGG